MELHHNSMPSSDNNRLLIRIKGTVCSKRCNQLDAAMLIMHVLPSACIFSVCCGVSCWHSCRQMTLTAASTSGAILYKLQSQQSFVCRDCCIAINCIDSEAKARKTICTATGLIWFVLLCLHNQPGGLLGLHCHQVHCLSLIQSLAVMSHVPNNSCRQPQGAVSQIVHENQKNRELVEDGVDR